MALHSFLGMEIVAPRPDALHAFCAEVGLVASGECWGNPEAPEALTNPGDLGEIAEAREKAGLPT